LTLIVNKINYLFINSDRIFTSFPHKLLKTITVKTIVKACIIVFFVSTLFSCTYFKGKTKQGNPAMDNAMISMTETEVKKRLGEPDIVSKTPDNHIIWTYRPSWKIMLDNKDTIYVEFEDGKVIKVTKGR